MKNRQYINLWSIWLVLISIQIIIGIIWGIKNIGVIPGFGDTIEYLELSDSFKLDEYRPVLFPLILKFIRFISDGLGVKYQIILYIIQNVICFFSLYYAISIFFDLKNLRLNIFMALYIMSIPMINWMNFTVLTDSIANSMLILMLTFLFKYLNNSENIMSLVYALFFYVIQ